MSTPAENTFTTGPLGPIYAKTALPIIFVMSMSGLLTVVDAMFLSVFVGEDALAAVTLMFPIYMLVIAVSTLVSNGMSSLLARALGASDLHRARTVFAGAHGLALVNGAVLIGMFLALGHPVTLLAAGGSQTLAQMGYVYLSITIFTAPLLFVLSVHSDALRNEGHVGFMAAMSLCVSLSNIGFNYLLIAILEMGVAGSALGTAAAQLLSFSVILGFRMTGKTVLHPRDVFSAGLAHHWRRILALGAPQSLNFIGFALGAAAVIVALQWVGVPNYGESVAAYGVITRVLTFGFLPLLGLSFAMQTITGNNYGAGLMDRSDASLRVALWTSLVYCGAVQAVLGLCAAPIARAFVTDEIVVAEITRLLPIITFGFVLAGPTMILSSYFQAIGSATRAALLGLTKPYAFALPLTFLLPLWLGEIGIWVAAPVAEVLLVGLAVVVLRQAARQTHLRWGLFHQTARGEL